LQQRLAELEAELSGLDLEYERLQVENEELKEQHEDIKSKNKMLFEQLTQGGGPSTDGVEHSLDGGGSSDPTSGANIGEIHSLY
jgi:predicted nuclease with TOPRIM domain